MKFDIARQPLLPALLILLICAVGAVVRVYQGVVAVELTPMSSVLGGFVNQLQTSCPVWSAVLAVLLVLVTGVLLGRIAVRFLPHSGKSLLSISLYGFIACGVFVSDEFLNQFLIALLLVIAIKNYYYSFCCGTYGFETIFRASFYLGLIPLLYTPALILVLLLPFGVAIFKRTAREFIVALAGLLLPMLTVCYLNWMAGGAFSSPLIVLRAGLGHVSLSLLNRLSVMEYALLAGVMVLVMGAVVGYILDMRAGSYKARMIQLFNMGIVLLTAMIFFMPGASATAVGLYAIPAALLIPILLVRIDRALSLLIYVVLFVFCLFLSFLY